MKIVKNRHFFTISVSKSTILLSKSAIFAIFLPFLYQNLPFSTFFRSIFINFPPFYPFFTIYIYIKIHHFYIKIHHFYIKIHHFYINFGLISAIYHLFSRSFRCSSTGTSASRPGFPRPPTARCTFCSGIQGSFRTCGRRGARVWTRYVGINTTILTIFSAEIGSNGGVLLRNGRKMVSNGRF
jgi:hypothetical protein